MILKRIALLSKVLRQLYSGRTQCNEWFNKFKIGDFDVRNSERGRPWKKFEDASNI